MSGRKIEGHEDVAIYPANLYVSPRDRLKDIIYQIQDDLVLQLEYFREQGRFLEAKRLEERVNFDLEMIRELGYCNGIENYSRYFDRRGQVIDLSVCSIIFPRIFCWWWMKAMCRCPRFVRCTVGIEAEK